MATAEALAGGGPSLAVLIAVVATTADRTTHPLISGERYTLHAWYLLGPWAIFYTGVLRCCHRALARPMRWLLLRRPFGKRNNLA